MYIHKDTCTYTHRHTHTHTCTYTQTHVQIHTCTYTCTYTQTHVQLYMHTQTHTNTHTCTHTHTHTTHPPINSCSTSLFTHRSGYCTLGGGREHSTHSLLCFHCAQLFCSLTAPSANDRSGLSSKPAQQDGPRGHTRSHHNFHSPLASR
ncbi:unnamed protein product [Staurois parvus]|uniref:Uncharacterized protein n=1 Tax=Staurois parvus TaxID=386267 RepID=A0ABN9FNK5_9NEOB|nr:unnamed protein product [Staurois parvus]